MALSNDLISQFVKVTQEKEQTNKESTAYGKIVKQGDTEYVQLDGSDLLTPISSTTVVKDGDRVMVTIKNHTAIVTGDLTNPSASDKDVQEIGNKISEFEIVIADKVTTKQLEAEIAKIDKLIADNIEATNGKFETIEGKVAEIDTIKADVVEVEKKITAHEGEFTTIRADIADFKDVTAERVDAVEGNFNTLNSDYADFKETTTNKLSANEGSIKELQTKKLDAETAEIKYANIDFSNIKEAAIEKLFSDSGIIKDLIMSDGKVTGELVGVTIKGDLIEGNTLKADKLVILGEDGLYYKLNVDALGETTASSDEKYQNGLDGSVIIAKSITADRVAVTDLVAFGATIGGYHITDHALYSGTKNSIDNTTRGVVLTDDGQIAIGDSNNYLKFFKDTDGKYKLAIQADNIKFSSGKTIEETITENNILIKDFEGENVILTDSGEYPFIDFSMKGKSEQEGTPTPNNPSPIKNVEGNVEVTVTGKNLAQINKGDVNSYRLIHSIPVEKGEKITVIFKGTETNNSRLGCYLYADETLASSTAVYLQSIPGDNTEALTTITIPNSGYFSIACSYGYQAVTVEKLFIGKGEYTLDDYEEYKSQIAYFPLAEGQKLMEGSYLSDDGVHNARGQVIFDGTEIPTIFTYGTAHVNTTIFKFSALISKMNGALKYSSHFKVRDNTVTTLNTDDNWVMNDNSGSVFICIENTKASTIEGIKAYLSEQYTNGTPIILEYELAEEEIVPYTEEQQAAWDELKSLHTYERITYIYSNNIVNPIFYGRYSTYVGNDVNTIINNETSSVRKEIQTNTTNILNDTQKMTNEALSDYVKNDDFNSYQKTVDKTFETIEGGFEMKFDMVDDRINSVEGDTHREFQEIQKYIRFVDGNIVLGETGNELTLKIQNDRISFLQSNMEVAYFSNNKLYVTDGEFLNSLQLGKFAFKPRANGSLSFGKVKN